jgi:hypothetical protein
MAQETYQLTLTPQDSTLDERRVQQVLESAIDEAVAEATKDGYKIEVKGELPGGFGGLGELAAVMVFLAKSGAVAKLVAAGQAGAYSEIIFGAVLNTYCASLGGCPTEVTDTFFSSYSGASGMPSLITNADQGVLLSFQAIEGSNSQTTDVYCIAPGCPNEIPSELTSSNSSYNPGATNSYLATISSGGVSLAMLNLPGQGGSIQPVLQRADSSYIGTANTSAGSSMIAFTGSGSTLFGVPNDTPQIATSGGGVIGASGTTYGQTGNVAGQLASVLAQSWTGNQYRVGSGQTQQVAATPIQPAGSFSPFQGANASANSTAGILETLYVRIFAPWKTFGPDPFAYTNGYAPVVNPCILDCFLGDNRNFTTAVNKGVVTARINGVVQFFFPGMVELNNKSYSDLTTAIYRRPPFNTGTSHPTLTVTVPSENYLDLEFEGADPLVPLAPDIDNELVITGVATPGQVCYSGWLSGDGFPNTEVFVVNSKGQAETLLNYATTSSRNAGPWTLLSPITINMGSFSNICIAQ